MVVRKLLQRSICTGYLTFLQKPTHYFIKNSVRYAQTANFYSLVNTSFKSTVQNLKNSCQLSTMSALSPLDPSSFSQPEIAIIKHISLIYDVIFEQKILNGVAELNFDILKPTNELILDVKDLTIHSVELKDGEQLKYEITDEVPNFGSKLTVTIPESDNTKITLKIKYTTSPNASALQWLSPNQTSGKQHPYLFSQCQPIHARSIVPCQDTPAVKFTYEAEVVAPAPFTVLMSALRQEPLGNRTLFRQPVPIPSYLLAIAVAVLDHRRLGPRSLVWTEKEEIEASASEFAETERYLQAAEALCGPYQWTQYDLLVLPPSFPYGGMENPCLTFVTPTLLAGDRSQADVIIHEIMHSWTGNLVTNRNFEHFWLNEGFTVFLERKVVGSLPTDKEEGRKNRDFESIQGLSELQEAVKETLGEGNPLTKLVVDLKGVHPDDSFSTVPYEKGSLFLRYLEDLVGGPEVFDDFLREYLKEYQRRSLDTDQFKQTLLSYFNGSSSYDNLKKVNWDAWLHASGMPPSIPNYDSSMTKTVNKFVDEINQGNRCSGEVSHLRPRQMIYFLQQLLESPQLTTEKLQSIDEACSLSHNNNSEIKYRWLRLNIRSRNRGVLDEVFKFLNSQGRMKYVRPIYRDLYAWEEVRERAVKNFVANEPFMMHVSAYTVRKDLHLQV